MQSVNITHENIEKIAKLFPNVITESKDENGILKKVVDFDLLKQELSNEIVESEKERYQLTWPGKKEAIVTANTPINKTLRPVKDDSADWDKTQNIYIEGDNLEVLKILQENYLNKVKCIYIDPPYNTGNDFIYKDNFSQDKDEYHEESGQIDENGNRLFQNNESNGRFHSDWLTMMYSRLKLARNLLSEDGAILISIDDNELENLKKICNEIFGEENFVATIINTTGASQNGEGVKFQKNYEACLVYCKLQDTFLPNKIDKAADNLRSLADAPTALITRPDMGYSVYYNFKTKDFIPVKDYDKSKIYLNDEKLVYKNDVKLIEKGYVPIRPGIKSNQLHRWRWGFDTFNERKSEIIIKEEKNKCGIYFKQSGYNPPKNIINYTVGTSELKSLFNDNRIFDFPKNVNMLKYLINICSGLDSFILDFFSGSATTAHAVMQLNAEDGGNRKYIMVQLPEKTLEDSEAYKAGYKNICEIGKERIRRAAKKIKEETNADIDYGFRVFKVDSSNMKDVYYTPEHLKQNELELFESNIKDGRSAEDLLIQVMLDFGLELSLPMETRKISGKTVHFVAGNSLAACFEEKISEAVIKAVAKEKPLRVVFRDSSFESDDSRINVEEIFKMFSPATEIKVI